MSFIRKTTGTMLLGMMGTAGLAHSAAVLPRDGAATTTVYQPTMYLIYPTEPDRSEPATTQLEVQRSGNTSILENVAVFKNIPATAKSCTLGWAQSAKADRPTFIVDGNGLLAAQQISSLPEGDITYAAIAPIVDEAVKNGEPLLHPDTTLWPDIETAETHVAGPINCAETIYLKLQIDNRDGEGFVYLGQDAKNGLTITIS